MSETLNKWYYVGCFIAAVVLQSFPRFWSDLVMPIRFFERALIIVLYLFIAWFFRKGLHVQWRWSILSSIFYVEAIAATALVLSMFLQLYAGIFVLITFAILFLRAAIYSYLASDRLPQLKGLVFFTCFIFLITAELILTLQAVV